MKRIIHLMVVVIFACLMIAYSTGYVTAYASEHASQECALCGKPADSHGGAVTVEHDGKHQVFCCQGCANKYEKEHHDESHHKDSGHHEHGDEHHEHEGHDH